MSWEEFFGWGWLWSGFTTIVVFSAMIGNYTLEFWHVSPYFLTPVFWAAIFVGLGLTVSCLIAGLIHS